MSESTIVSVGPPALGFGALEQQAQNLGYVGGGRPPRLVQERPHTSNGPEVVEPVVRNSYAPLELPPEWGERGQDDGIGAWEAHHATGGGLIVWPTTRRLPMDCRLHAQATSNRGLGATTPLNDFAVD